MGVNGKVGQAAVQIATWHGARVIGVVRKAEAYEGHANSHVEVIDASATDVATRVRGLTGGKGADIVFNTVGDPYFQAAHKSLALRGRQILIAAVDRIVQFNILEFYRGQHTYVGIDTLGLSSVATGDGAAGTRPRFRQRASKAVSDQAKRDLPAGTSQSRLRCRRRLVTRPRDPAAVASFAPSLRGVKTNAVIPGRCDLHRRNLGFAVAQCCPIALMLASPAMTGESEEHLWTPPRSSSSPPSLIGLIYGSVGLLSGFCMMSSMRGWLAEGDGRLVRTYALAMGVASRPRRSWRRQASSISASRSICSRSFRRR